MLFLYPNIEAERARANMTQEDLANKLKIERKSYYNWQTKGNIPINILLSLADIFNCSTDYLLGRTNNPSCSVEAIRKLTLPNSRNQHRKGDVKSELMYNYDTNKSVYICGILNYRNKNNSCPHYKNA